jgi:hypothetical protein
MIRAHHPVSVVCGVVVRKSKRIIGIRIRCHTEIHARASTEPTGSGDLSGGGSFTLDMPVNTISRLPRIAPAIAGPHLPNVGMSIVAAR